METQDCFGHRAAELLGRDGAGLEACDVLIECGCARRRCDKEDAALGLAPVYGTEVRSVTQGLKFRVHQPSIWVRVERVRLHRRDEGLVFRGSAELSLVRLDTCHWTHRLSALDICDSTADAVVEAEQPADELETQDQQHDDKI